jgi:hypothetical protein
LPRAKMQGNEEKRDFVFWVKQIETEWKHTS